MSPPTEFTVQVPATTANLGPGYDLLGLALNQYNRLTFRLSDHYQMRCSGPHGKIQYRLDAKNLVWQGVERVYREMGVPMPCFAVDQWVAIPPARGMGSSSSAIVAGLFAANLWLGQPLSKTELLPFATEIEGHPDNVAPALLGGAIMNFPQGEQPFCHLPIPDNLYFGVCVPRFTLKTKTARQVIPQSVPLNHALQNLSYLGALLVGFQTGQHALIAQGLDDTLHQPYRQSLVPGMADIIQWAKTNGALGCVLSGAGPSLLVIGDRPLTELGKKMCLEWKKHEIEADFVTCLIDRQGVVCLD